MRMKKRQKKGAQHEWLQPNRPYGVNVQSEVATLVNEELKPGRYEVTWDAGGLSGGVYLYRMQAGDFAVTKKFVLLR
jgi:hypothetical protein